MRHLLQESVGGTSLDVWAKADSFMMLRISRAENGCCDQERCLFHRKQMQQKEE